MNDTAKANKSQLDKFKDAARDLECDDDEEKFGKRLKKIVREKTPSGGKS